MVAVCLLKKEVSVDRTAETTRQIMDVFADRQIPAGGMLKRLHFFTVRDADFQDGMDCAVANGWVALPERDRHRYFLTAAGKAACASLSRSLGTQDSHREV